MDKKSLLIKFYHGQCTQEEIHFLLSNLSQEDLENYDEVIKELWEQNDFYKLDSVKSERIYNKILRNAEGLKAGYSKVKNSKPIFLSIAAVSIGVLLISVAVFFFIIAKNQINYETAFGEKQTIILPDSSVVILNSNSSISYLKSDFDQSQRKVWLNGEAYFDIKKRSFGHRLSKFIVSTKDLSVLVLGTKFNINSRREDIDIVLETGKIKLQIEEATAASNIEALEMKPSDHITYLSKEKRFVKKVVDPQDYISWLNNILVFNDVPIEKIAEAIEDNFGYKLIFENPEIKSKTYKGVFPSDNIDILLASLAKSFGLKINKNGDIIMMKK